MNSTGNTPWAHALHTSGRVTSSSVLAETSVAQAPLSKNILQGRVPSFLAFAIIIAASLVVGSGSIVASQERVAAAYMEYPGPHHHVLAAVSRSRVLGATTAVPAPVSSLTIRADLVGYLYRCMLGYEGDQSGLDFWVGTMATDPDPVNHLYRSFYQSGQFNKSVSNSDFVTKLYQCVMFRNPNDPPDNNFSGRDFWANEMAIGHQTQSSMLEVFLGSTEYTTNILPKLAALPVSIVAPVSPVTISLSASSTSVAPGATVYLSWSVANAADNTATFDNSIGVVGTSGNKAVNPTSTTTYNLSASNSLGTVVKAITITVVPLPVPQNRKPLGYLDSISGNSVSGWSVDLDSSAASNEVHFYIDGTDSTHLAGHVSANILRTDVNSTLGITGNHGFSWTIPDSYKDNIQHTLYVFGIDLNDSTGASNVQLTSSPKTFILASAVIVLPESTLQVVAPAANENWQVGTQHTITWTSTNLTSTSLVSISVSSYIACLYTKPACALPQPLPYIVAAHVANTGSYAWTIPTDLSASFQGSVTLSVQADNGTTSGSSQVFTITTLTTPVVKQVATPVVNPKGGTFTTAQQVVLSDETPGATIRYTTDNAEPTATSALYSGPLTVSSTSTVKAKAFAASMTDSFTAQATFTISPAPVINRHPAGYLDAIDVSRSIAYGWGYDPDQAESSIDIHIYIDGLAASNLAGYIKADQARSDINTAGITGNHGFVWTIPSQYKDGAVHTLYAFGIDINDATGASNVQLSSSPKTFKFEVAPPPPPPAPTATVGPISFPTNSSEFVKGLYTCILNLAATDNQTTLFVNKLNADGDVAQIYRLIYGDPAFGPRHLSNENFIRDLYYCVLYRQSDPATTDSSGYNFWLGQVNKGRSWETTLEAFLQSGEFRDNVVPRVLAFRTTPAITQLNLDPRLSVTHVDGSYPKKDADFFLYGSKDIRSLGFQGIEVYMAPEMCAVARDSAGNALKSGSYQTLDWCDSRAGAPNISPNYHSLGELAMNPRYTTLFNMDFKNYFITAETINPDRVYPEPSDCVAAELNRINAFNVDADCYKNGFSQRQLKSLHDDFYTLFTQLLNSYKNTGKTFVILSGNELENHFEVGGTYPDWAINNMISYLNTVSQALADAKSATPSQGVAVYHACEFASNFTAATLSGAKEGINNVVPNTHCDLYGWSAWAYTVYHPDDTNYLTTALNYFASKAPDSPVFGNHNIFLSEFGSAEHYHPLDQTLKLLNDGINAAFAWGVPYINYWQIYDNECQGINHKFPITDGSTCSGFWLRQPAADPTQPGSLSEIYNQVFLPRKQQ